MFTPSEAQREALYARVQAESEADLKALFGADPIPPQRTGPTGPRTEAGKQKSRLNAYKHGLTGQIHLFTPEEKAEFAAHCQGIVESLAPVGAHETDLAQTIAEGRWRLKRARAIESTLYAFSQEEVGPVSQDPLERRLDDAGRQLRVWLIRNKEINNLALYEGRVERTIQRNMSALQALQAARREALEEEVLLAELAESEGETYAATPNPAHPEFVFSTAEILQALTRKKRLKAARALVAKRPTAPTACQKTTAA